MFNSKNEFSIFPYVERYIPKNQVVRAALESVEFTAPELHLRDLLLQGNPIVGFQDVFSDPDNMFIIIRLARAGQISRTQALNALMCISAVQQHGEKCCLKEADKPRHIPRPFQFISATAQSHSSEVTRWCEAICKNLIPFRIQIPLQELLDKLKMLSGCDALFIKIQFESKPDLIGEFPNKWYKTLADNHPCILIKETTLIIAPIDLQLFVFTKMNPDGRCFVPEPTFGKVLWDPFLMMHQEGCHPIPIYHHAVRDNMNILHGHDNLLGPLSVFLHDLTHCALSSVFSSKDIKEIHDVWIKQILKPLKDKFRAFPDILSEIQNTINKLTDLDWSYTSIYSSLLLCCRESKPILPLFLSSCLPKLLNPCSMINPDKSFKGLYYLIYAIILKMHEIGGEFYKQYEPDYMMQSLFVTFDVYNYHADIVFNHILEAVKVQIGQKPLDCQAIQYWLHPFKPEELDELKKQVRESTNCKNFFEKYFASFYVDNLVNFLKSNIGLSPAMGEEGDSHFLIFKKVIEEYEYSKHHLASQYDSWFAIDDCLTSPSSGGMGQYPSHRHHSSPYLFRAEAKAAGPDADAAQQQEQSMQQASGTESPAAQAGSFFGSCTIL